MPFSDFIRVKLFPSQSKIGGLHAATHPPPLSGTENRVKFTGHNAEMLCGWGVKAE